MQILDAFPSSYLKASDLQNREVTVTMNRVEIEIVGKEKDKLPVLYFQGKEKGLVLNKTNAKKIVEMYGDDTEGWTGGEIVLYEAMVEFQGDTVPSIRVRLTPRNPNGPKQVTRTTPPPPAEIIDDDIPF